MIFAYDLYKLFIYIVVSHFSILLETTRFTYLFSCILKTYLRVTIRLCSIPRRPGT